MKCLDPIKIIQVPRFGYRPTLMTVPCGHCMACLASRAQQWTFRLMQEWRHAETAHFITLTYSDSNLVTINGKPTVWKKDFQNFMKKLRNNLLRMFHRTVQLRYYAVSEYGPSHERPHMHIILFNYPYDLDLVGHVNLAWNCGFVTVAPLNEARVRYCAGYVNELSDYPDDVVRPWSLMSRKPPIGDCWMSEAIRRYYDMSDDIVKPYIVDDHGVKVKMPRYYKERIFDMPRQQLIGVMSRNRILNEDKRLASQYGGFFVLPAPSRCRSRRFSLLLGNASRTLFLTIVKTAA